MRPIAPEFNAHTKAVIYCRVSSAKQTVRGDGLGSQEQRCREYARYKGLDVVEIFRDDASGSLATRPGMQAMLAYLRRHRKKGAIVVLIDDISRLARGIDAHLKLRAAIGEAGGILKSPTIEFGEDSDSILVENLLASVSQHQRQKNGEQTINRMRARTMNGYWCFAAPIGYRYKRVSGHGNMLVRDEPYASILQEAFEGFAAGRFDTQTEVKRFLERQPEYPKDLPNGEIRNSTVAQMLVRPIYAGYVEASNWNVPRRKGHHEGIISGETFARIQERLAAGARAPIRKDIDAEFPLRGFVACDDCGHPLTSCWSRSSTGKLHPYYFCHVRSCPSARKSIPRDRIEGEFETLLKALQPAEGLFKIVQAMFTHVWEQRQAQAAAIATGLRKELKDLAAQTEKLLDRIVQTDNPAVVSAYEKKVSALESRRLILTEQADNTGKPRYAFDDLFELAMRFLANPWNLWASGHLQLRRTVLRLAFSERARYRRGVGFSNARIALPFRLLSEVEGSEKGMAHPTRFERVTFAFGGQR